MSVFLVADNIYIKQKRRKKGTLDQGKYQHYYTAIVFLNFRPISIASCIIMLPFLTFTNIIFLPPHHYTVSMARTKRKFAEFTPIEKDPDTKRARQNRSNLIADKKKEKTTQRG